MRTTSFITIAACATSAIAGVVETRQLGTWIDPLAMFLSSKPAIKTSTLQPEITRNNVLRKVVRFGPYVLKATDSKENTGNFKSMDPAGTAFVYLAGKGFPKDATFLSTDVKLRFENGTNTKPRDGIYQHHLLFADLSKTPSKYFNCGPQSLWQSITSIGKDLPGLLSIFAGGAEDGRKIMYTNGNGSFNSGYYIGPRDNILIQLDIVNSKKYQQTVFVDLDVEYIEGKVPEAMESAMQVVGVGFCGGDGEGLTVKPPPGQKKFQLKGSAITASRDGVILTARGHLHDGGSGMNLVLNGKAICSSQAKYTGEPASMTGMSDCQGPLPIKKGDTITMSADYDLEAHPPRMMHDGMEAEEMALMNIFLAWKPEDTK